VPNQNLAHFIKIAAICVLAAALNHLIFPVVVLGFRMPLFMDTVFTAAVTFYAGLIPGLAAALLTWVIGFTIKDGIINPFIICSIAEVILIFLLKPSDVRTRGLLSEEKKSFIFATTLASLMVLYITVCITISTLGGLIDYIFYTEFPNTKPDYSAEDAFKEWFSDSPIPMLILNILSRVPVNLVDRFIVIFGGYFISRGMVKMESKLFPKP